MPLRIIAAVAAVSLLAILAFGASLALMIPIAAEDALHHSLESAGGFGDEYAWLCPTADGRSYDPQTLTMHIDEDSFLHSTRGSVLRQGTRLVSCPFGLVDPDDKYVGEVAGHILGCTAGYPDLLRAEAALSFVQCAVQYEHDSDLFGVEDFWASPTETLFLHRGDCEDTSVLLCSVLLAMGYRCALLDFPGHVAVGVYLGDSEDYLFCETTYDVPLPIGSGGYAAGEDPEVYGDFYGSPLTAVNGLLASCRDLIRTVAGT